MAHSFRDFEYAGWQQSVVGYDRFFGPLTTQTIEPLLDAVRINNEAYVLDIATGPGYAAAAARGRGARVVGIDFSHHMVALAKELNAKDISFAVGDAEHLEHPSSTFDSVLMNFGILHLSQPEQAIMEAFRVLRPNGRFGFTVWEKPEKARGFSIINSAIESQGDTTVALPSGPPFFKFSNEADSNAILTKCGFTHLSATIVPMLWSLDSPTEFFDAFFTGTGRTGGLLRAQPPSNLAAIRNAAESGCTPFRQQNGGLIIPMSAIIFSGQKGDSRGF